MSIYRFARLALAAATLFGQSVTARGRCFNPSVRHEWRSLTSHERAEWITAIKVNPPEHASRITDTLLPSAFTHCLTTLPWCRHLTQPTPRFHPSTPVAHISTVGLCCIFSQILLISYRIRLGLRPYGSQSYCKSLLNSPSLRTIIRHKPRSTTLASSCPGIVHMSKTSKLFFRRNADTRVLTRTGTGHSV